MRRIIDDCYKKAYEIISQNKDLLDLIANTLIEKETITKEEIDYLVKNGKLPEAEVEKKEAKLEELTLDELRAKAKEAGLKSITKLTKEELIDKLKELDK
jgi:cell division protease FtsH